MKTVWIAALMLVCGGVAAAQDETPLTTVRVASGLSRPIFVTSPPADTARVFIAEQRGSAGVSNRADIRILRLSDNVLLPTPFLSITGVSTGSEQGLLGLAFHPNFASNRQFFVNYTDSSGQTVIRRFRASATNPNVVEAGSGLTILVIQQPQANHNGGWTAFGPDGFLYIGMGDGGGGGDAGEGHHATLGNGQFLGTLLGKILRIDVDHPAAPFNYSVPPSNPFSGSVTNRKEIWAYGLRNPWRNAFDRETGELYIADVGQDEREEINVQPAGTGGRNYGWRCFEGAAPYNTSNCPGNGSLTFPIHTYSHNDGCSITGGYVYRGSAIPSLRGTYFFADFCAATIWSLRYEGASNPPVTDRTAELTGDNPMGQVMSFGEDARGEIYITDNDGQVFRIEPATPVATAMGPAVPQSNARFGWAVAGLRDVSGDARGDAAVGEPLADLPAGFTACGRVHIHNGETGALLRSIDPPNKQPGGQFGYAMAGLDNVNGDGLGDLLVGAPRQHPGAAPVDAGRAYIFRGDTGVLLRAIKSPGEQAGSLFGLSVAPVADLNGDGRTEYLISAPGETVGGQFGAGRAYLYNGVNGALMRTLWSPAYEHAGHFGWSVASVPDATGDGKADLLIGAPNDDPGAAPNDCGRAYLFNTATYALVRVFASPFAETSSNFGFCVVGTPDVNGDGRGDVLVGAPGDSPGSSPSRSGRAYLYSGATGVYLCTLSPPVPLLNAEFGYAVAASPDVTGDGRGDVGVCAPRDTASGLAEAGRVYVFSGATGVLHRDILSPNTELQGRFGWSVGVAPDVDGDGLADLVIGAPLEDPGATPAGSGAAYIVRN